MNVVEQLAEAVDDGAEAHGRDRLAFGTAEMGAEDDLGLAAESVLDGGKGLADASVVGDRQTVFGERDVEVDTDEDALVGEIEIADGELAHFRFSPGDTPLGYSCKVFKTGEMWLDLEAKVLILKGYSL